MTPAAATGAPEPPSHRQIQLTLAGLMLGMLLPALTTTIVATALPTIVAELGDLSQLSWIVTAYLLASAVAIPLVGKASDLYGRRPLFQLAVLLFVLGSVLCGVAQSMGQLIAARALQGVAAGSLLTLAQAGLGDVVAPRQRGRYQGYLTSVFALASVAGPLIGGFLVDHVSWRWVFLANVPIGLVALAVNRRYLPPGVRNPARGSADWAGALLLTGALSAFLLVVVWGGQRYAWTSPTIISLAGAATLGVLTLVVVEHRAREPIMPPRLFCQRVVTAGVLLGFVFTMVMFVAIVFLPTFLQVAGGVSATGSGLVLVPLMVSHLAANIVSGRLVTRWGRYRPFPMLGGALTATGFALLATMDAGTGITGAGLRTIPLGAGLGMSMSVAVLAIQNAVPVRDLGIATSASQLFRTVGGAVGLTVFGAVVNTRLTRQVAERLTDTASAWPSALPIDAVVRDPAAVEALPDVLRTAVRAGLADALLSAFLLVVPVALLAVVLSLALRELPLRDTNGPADAPEPI